MFCFRFVLGSDPCVNLVRILAVVHSIDSEHGAAMTRLLTLTLYGRVELGARRYRPFRERCPVLLTLAST